MQSVKIKREEIMSFLDVKSVRTALLAVTFWGLIQASSPVQAQQDLPPEVLAYADVIFHNGNILTADDSFNLAEAVAIRDETFMAVGEDTRILKMAGPRTRVIDLQGKTVTPGLIDTHFHLHNYTFNPRAGGEDLWPVILVAELGGDKTKENFLRVLEKKAKDIPRREGWVVVTDSRGEGHSILERNIIPLITRQDLDTLFPDEPAVIGPSHGNNYSYYILNSAALEILLERIPADTEGIHKNPTTGEPTGQLTRPAAELFGVGVLPWPDMKKVMQLLRDGIPRYTAQGLTMMQTKTPGYVTAALREFWRRGEMPIRWRAQIDVGPDTEIALKYLGNLTDLGDPWLRITAGPGGVPSEYWDATYQRPELLPGQIPRGDRSAEPGQAENRRPTDAFLATKYGWSMTNVHNNGDLSTDAYLTEIEKGLKERVIEAYRQRFASDHSLMLTPTTPGGNQFERMKKLGIIPSLNVNYLLEPARLEKGFEYSSMTQVEQLAHKWGKDRVARMLPAKSLIKAGFKPTSESDRWEYPSSSPLYILERLITRKEEGRDFVWGPDERVTRQEALWMKTNWAAYYSGEEELLGTIEPGKLADLVVLDKDYLTVPADEISEIKVLMTMIGAKVIFQDDSFNP
ncbi:MAG: amidohydrolase family protein [Candidatus Binatia bacterium]